MSSRVSASKASSKKPFKDPKEQRNWRNFLINPSYQLKYCFWVTLTGLFLVLFNSSVFYFYVRENYSILVDLSPMTDEAKSLLYRELNDIVVKLLLASLFFLALIAAAGIVLSHRTAGPLYHFKKVFLTIKKGDFSRRVRLRPTDDFRDVAKAFNDMMDQLEDRIDKRRP